MNDNPYKESMERIQGAKSMGKMFVVGFVLLALGEFVEVFVRYKSPYILSEMIIGPAGIKPSEIVKHYQLWSWVSVTGSVISLVGSALLLYTIWKHLAVPASARSNEM